MIMKPPTTFVVAAQTATKPRMVLTLLCCDPAATKDPTREIPLMAFVPLMSGVCRRAGTREITW